MALRNIEITRISKEEVPEVLSYLQEFEETSQFLINNLTEYGPTAGEFLYSGDFKAIKDQGKIKGVFYLARAGNVYAQTSEDFSGLILQECLKESFPITGFLGDWKVISPIYNKYKDINPNFHPSFESREILFRIDFEKANARGYRKHPSVRFLTEVDFDLWLPLRMAYVEELGLTGDLSLEQRRQQFIKTTAAQLWWGYFEDEELISIAGLNSSGKRVGQVGGVFTPKEHRNKGYSKVTMEHLLADCRDVHLHKMSILFTGEESIAARKVYESLGYESIGHFALILK